MSNNTTRMNFATLVENECLKNPELLTNFIGIVSDELSNQDLIRIFELFIKSKENVHSKMNLKN